MSDPPRPVSGFVPIGDMADGLSLPGGRALTPHAATPQARHHFTTLHQVNQLIEASEADVDMGFMARLLALCSLPRTNPKTRLQYVRRNGPYTLYVTVSAGEKLPFGNLPRLLLAWVCSEAVRTQQRELVLGRSLYEFMRKIGLEDRSGGANAERTRLKNQMRRLFGCTVTLVYEDEEHESRVSSLVADRADYWWNAKRPAAPVLWDSTIELGEKFFSGDHRAPCTARPAHPQGAQAGAARPRSVLLARVSHLLAQGSINPLVEAALSAVRRGAGPGEQSRSTGFPSGLSARVEENQERVAGSELPHGDGWARRFTVAAAHPAATTPAHQRVGQPAARICCEVGP